MSAPILTFDAGDRGGLIALLDAVASDIASDSQWNDLEALLKQNESARAMYVEYFRLQTELRFHLSLERADAAMKAALASEILRTPASPEIVGGQWSVEKGSPSTSSQLTTDHGQRTTSSIPQSAIRIPQSTFPSSLLAYLSRPMPFSLIFSTVFLVSILTILGMWVLPNDGGQEPRGISVSPLQFVAQLTGESDCRWGDPSDALFPGAHLQSGRVLDLRKGVAKVRFKSGAVAMIEGPTVFVLEDNNRGRLDQGRLVARIEKKEAVGFTVRTPSATVVDLGTEFGVVVNDDKETEVHVFLGSVEVQGQGAEGSESKRLAAGESIVFETRRGILEHAYAPEGFANLRRIQPEPGTQAAETKSRRERILEDPALVAYYDFQPDNPPNVLMNRATGPDAAPHGEINGFAKARWIDGPVNGTSALAFNGFTDFVEIPDHPSLRCQGPMTLLCWVRIDDVPRGFARVLGKGNAPRLRNYGFWIAPGQKASPPLNGHFFQWQVYTHDEQGRTINHWINGDFAFEIGHWYYLSAVIDHSRQWFCVDGRPLGGPTTIDSRQMAVGNAPFVLGKGEEDYYTSLYGALAEVVVLRRPLSQKEILQLQPSQSNP